MHAWLIIIVLYVKNTVSTISMYGLLFGYPQLTKLPHFLLLTSLSWATEAADRFLFLEVDVPGVFGGRPDGPAGLSAKRRVLLGSTFSAMAWQPLQLQSGESREFQAGPAIPSKL